MNGEHYYLEVNSNTTAQEIVKIISSRNELGDMSDWGLYDSDGLSGFLICMNQLTL
jgi:hypothetical protein